MKIKIRNHVKVAPALSNRNKLNTANAELLLYDDSELYIEILGGIKITGLDRMKVTLKILHKQTTAITGMAQPGLVPARTKGTTDK